MSITVYFTGLDRFQISLTDKRHLNKHQGKNNGGRSTNVGKQDVYGGPDGGMGEQTRHQPDVKQPPDLLHREVARKAPTLGSHGQIVSLQGSSTGSARTSSSNRGRGNAGNDVCTLTKAASIAARGDGHSKQGHNGGNDGVNECPNCSPRWKKVPS
jgi:hypothetical protein